jgi:hypothetical protein
MWLVYLATVAIAAFIASLLLYEEPNNPWHRVDY